MVTPPKTACPAELICTVGEPPLMVGLPPVTCRVTYLPEIALLNASRTVTVVENAAPAVTVAGGARVNDDVDVLAVAGSM